MGDSLSFSWVSSDILDGGEGGGEDWGRGVLMLDVRPRGVMDWDDLQGKVQAREHVTIVDHGGGRCNRHGKEMRAIGRVLTRDKLLFRATERRNTEYVGIR